MKRCPQCQRLETDDALVYCRADGSPLVLEESAVSEIETSLLPNAPTSPGSQRSTGPTTALPQQDLPRTTRDLDKRDGGSSSAALHRPHVASTRNSIIAGVLGIVLMTALGVGSYLKYGRSDKQINSIAVMPFINESGNQDVEYLSDGMTETLISSLSQIPNLSVKARSTVFFYKGKETTPKKIGEDLGVQAVLLGRVAERGDDLRLSLELVNTETQNVLWSDTYNRKPSELVSLQSEVVRDVSSKLKAKLSGVDAAKVGKTYTDNAEAYQLYLKGKYFWNKRTGESLKQAAQLYRQAIDKDPNYALAYSGLAETYVLFSSYDVSPANDSMPQAKAAALRALEIDDSLAEAHTALAFYLSNYEWDRVNSEKEYRRAIELKPNYSTAHHWFAADLSNVRRFDDSLAEFRRAEELDPLSPIIGTNLGDTLVYAHRYDEAIAQYKRTLLRNPDFAYAHRALGWAYGLSGNYPEAIAETRRSFELNKSSSAKGYLGLWLAKSGKRDEALQLLSELKQESASGYVQSYTFALIYLGLGDKEQALDWLVKEVSGHSEVSNQLAVAPELAELRSTSRFQELLKQMNLPQ
ncbi:MAG TPA: tetratricopeptide repeat protein [Pyrinomonadaceae bacterium]|nr:tetratricopeptide repeat protein [Pyrinomonadaceae bacterium]